MRVVILGGNRFVGRRVAGHLIRRGNEVTVLHRSRASTPGAATIRGTRTSPTSLARLVALRPDAIVDMSLYSEYAAELLIAALRDQSVRYLAVSTAAIYSQTVPPPWNERTRVDPAPGWGQYGIEKAKCDAVILNAKLANAVIVRPPYVIGTNDPDERCQRLFARVRREAPVLIPGDGSSLIQVIDARDMAIVLVRLLEGDVTGVVDVPGAGPISVRSFIEQCAAATQEGYECRMEERHAGDYRPDRWPFPNLNLWVSGDRFRATCSIRLRSLQETLGDTLRDWQHTL